MFVPDYMDGYEEEIQETLNPTVAHLVEGVARMSRIRTMKARSAAADRMRRSRHYEKCCWRWRRTSVSSS